MSSTENAPEAPRPYPGWEETITVRPSWPSRTNSSISWARSCGATRPVWNRNVQYEKAPSRGNGISRLPSSSGRCRSRRFRNAISAFLEIGSQAEFPSQLDPSRCFHEGDLFAEARELRGTARYWGYLLGLTFEETIESALRIAETGHLTFSSLHTNSAANTINRIVDVFPAHQQNQTLARRGTTE